MLAPVKILGDQHLTAQGCFEGSQNLSTLHDHFYHAAGKAASGFGAL